MPSAIGRAESIYLLKEAQEFSGVKEYFAYQNDYDLGSRRLMYARLHTS
jgi:hypothetical protein